MIRKVTAVGDCAFLDFRSLEIAAKVRKVVPERVIFY